MREGRPPPEANSRLGLALWWAGVVSPLMACLAFERWIWIPGWIEALSATAAVTAVQLTSAVAGRGRAAPGARLAPVLRFAIVLAFAIGFFRFEAWWAIGFVALCEVVSRAGGPSVAAWSIATWLAMNHLYLPGQLGRVSRHLDVAWTVTYLAPLTAFAAVALATRILRLGPRRLALLGILPWAPTDLAAIPFVARQAAVDRMIPDHLQLIGFWTLWVLPHSVAALEIAALVYLERRLRAAEARAAARAIDPPDR